LGFWGFGVLGFWGFGAVAAVIENRKNTPGFPKSYCSVIWQYKQFSYRNHLKHGMIMPIGEDKRIERIADEMIRGYFFSPIRENVLYYCTTKVKPYWIKDVKRVLVIDGHQFFERK
jgi:spore germination cell wall hydrolase CwlJ-like protein